MSKLTVAATQMACTWDRDANLARPKIDPQARDAAARDPDSGVFETPYFCKDHAPRHFELARPLEVIPPSSTFGGWRANSGGAAGKRFRAREQRVLQLAGHGRCGWLVLEATASRTFPKGRAITRSSTSRRRYRFKVSTRRSRDRCGHLLGQWFPRRRAASRSRAELLLYPTAIGPSPRIRASIRAVIGSAPCKPCGRQHHAAGGFNRSAPKRARIHHDFLRSSFIASRPAKSGRADRSSESVLTAAFDLDEVRRYRQRGHLPRPASDLYHSILPSMGG